MVTRKSSREIELMKEAGKIVALAHEAVKGFIRPGVSTKEIDDLVEKVIISYGAIPSFKNYNGFPASACISINVIMVTALGHMHAGKYLKMQKDC